MCSRKKNGFSLRDPEENEQSSQGSKPLAGKWNLFTV